MKYLSIINQKIGRKIITSYTGWPRINGTVDTVDFQDFALINN